MRSSTGVQKKVEGSPTVPAGDGNAGQRPPRSLEIANKGIKTGSDFAQLMSALMSDLIDGRVTPNVGNATCNAGGKLLKVVEMQYKYGTKGPGQNKTLILAVSEDCGDKDA